ncbi:MAG: thioredoxin family protein [Pyrinomonadaceae bacterium]
MKNYIARAMTFAEYENLIDKLLAEGKTTGLVQSEAMFGYGTLNRRRMLRVGKTVELSESLRRAVKNYTRPLTWLIITEGWCGDAAQNIPVIEKIAAQSDKINTLYLLRDENPELIDQFLTGGARSIPKLIAIDPATLNVLGSWGARPSSAQQLFESLKAIGNEKSVIQEEIQRWYNYDKGRSLQTEFEGLLSEWSNVQSSKAAA